MGHCKPADDALPLPREPIPVPSDADRAAAFPHLHQGHAHGRPPWMSLTSSPVMTSTTPGAALAPQVAAPAEVYARLVYQRSDGVDVREMGDAAMQAWLAWWETTPDTPCIAICSTSQGDAVCKGCGRSFDEVQHWLAYSPVQKRAVWRSISLQGTAWRFNRYAERARAASGITSSE